MGTTLALNTLFTAALLLIPFCFIRTTRVKQVVYFMINSIACLISYCVGVTGELPGPSVIAAVLNTNVPECLGLFRATAVLSVALSATWLLQMMGLFYLARWPTFSRQSPIYRYIGLLLLPLALPFFTPELRAMYPYALVPVVKKMHDYLQVSAKLDDSLLPELHSLNHPNSTVPNEVMVLVIGESSQAEFWQINGFKLATSPYMEKRQQQQELINFPHHMSSSSATILAVPSLLTPFGELIQYHENTWTPSIVALMKKAGRRTAWFSTQGPQPASTEAQDVDFGEDLLSYYGKNQFDEELIPRASKWLQTNANRPGFLVLHTLGSHIPFERRYPPVFEKWAVPEQAYPQSQTIENYSNTILYTDALLERLIQQLEREHRPAILVYVSDHGESIMNGVTRSSAPASPAVLHVPFLIWANQQWRLAHKEQWSLLHQRAMSLSVTHHLNVGPTLMHLAGWSYATVPAQRDLLSPLFTPWLATPAIEADLSTVLSISPP
jgi:glucan phosphoethanolaminetransferase (alkaline phosphatase superfamily)